MAFSLYGKEKSGWIVFFAHFFDFDLLNSSFSILFLSIRLKLGLGE
jgi:hypothetical protein